MTFLSTIVIISGTAMALANFPQAFKIFKRKSAKDLSILTLSILLIGSVIWILYGLEINNFPIIIANVVGTVGVTLVIIGWSIYGGFKNA